MKSKLEAIEELKKLINEAKESVEASKLEVFKMYHEGKKIAYEEAINIFEKINETQEKKLLHRLSHTHIAEESTQYSWSGNPIGRMYKVTYQNCVCGFSTSSPREMMEHIEEKNAKD